MHKLQFQNITLLNPRMKFWIFISFASHKVLYYSFTLSPLPDLFDAVHIIVLNQAHKMFHLRFHLDHLLVYKRALDDPFTCKQ